MQRYVDGHVNETVERRNFRRQFQQEGESFDDYLISLRELAKTCSFCSDLCMQKNLRDQIIEGLHDGDTIESLLQEADLTLDVMIAKCRSKEAAKKNQSQIKARGHDTEAISVLHNPKLSRQQGKPAHVRDAEERSTRVGGSTAQPMTDPVLSATRLATLPESAEANRRVNSKHKPKPARPFQEAAADLCSHAGKSYLVWVDCYSGWPIIALLDRDTTDNHITAACTELFSQTAIPDIVWTDGGPQFTSKVFQDFLHQWGVTHRKSTPHYPQSNGKAEATVNAMKKILRVAWTGCILDKTVLCGSLMQYHNTPSAKDGHHQLKNYMDTPYKTISLSTQVPSRARMVAELSSDREAHGAIARGSRKTIQLHSQQSPRNLCWNKCCCTECKDKVMGHLQNHYMGRPSQAISRSYSEWADITP